MAKSLPLGQIPYRVKGQTTCVHHRGTQLELFCKKCKVPACTQCLSSVHNCHPVCELREIIPPKKQDIADFMDKIENDDLVQTVQNIHFTDKQIKDNASTFKKLSSGLKKRTKKIKQDLDLLTLQTLSFYEQLEKENTKLLEAYKQHLEMCNALLKEQMQECKRVLQCGLDLVIYDKACEINDSCVTLPVEPTLGTVSFTPNKNPLKLLKQALGEISTSDQFKEICKSSSHQDRSAPSSADEELNTQHRIPSEGSPRVTNKEYKLLSHAKVVGELHSPCRIGSLCLTADGQLWTKYSKTLTLLDGKGTVVQEVKHNNWINSISISQKTNTLWVCDDDQIMKLESGRLITQFSTDEDILCICMTANNQVIVGKAKHIAKFTTKGEIVTSTMLAGTQEPLVHSPYRISECPVTNNVAVIDRNSQKDGGDGSQQVVVMDTCLEKVFVYDGELLGEYATSDRTPFDPSDVTFDSAGNLVIGDCNDCCVLLISGRGEFLRVLYTDTDKTWAVGVDRENDLWTVFGGKRIELLKYRRVK